MYGLEFRLKQPTSLAAKIGADSKEKNISFEDASKGIRDAIRYTAVSDTKNFVNNYIVSTSPTGFVLYILLIMFFGYFYTFMELNPEEMSKNLNKNGGYIPGVRPGVETTNYISNIIGKLTIVGSIFLVIIAGLPILFSKFSGLPSSVTIGGTGLLIVVGVAIETYKQIESSLVSREYKRGRRRR